MAIDPNLLIPAALMNRSIAPARSGLVRPGVDRQGVLSVYQDGRGMNIPRENISRPSGPEGLAGLSQAQFITEALGGDLMSQAPMSLKQSFAGSMGLPESLLASQSLDETVSEDQAKNIGTELFGPRLENADPKKLMTAATDNIDDVDDSLKGLYSENPELMAILGATTKLASEEKATSDLLSTILNDKTTPEKAREKVNKFFGTDPDKETPVWADVALSVGLSLLRGESGTGEFLKDVGVAGERGLAVAKARGKEKRARTDTLNKLAFGVYREDEKQRTALASQLRTNLSKMRTDQQKFGLDMAKYFQKTEEINATTAKNRGDAITKTLNTLSDDQKAKAFPIIARNADAFKNVTPDQVASTMFGLLKTNGLSLDNVADSKNIVESDVTISDKPTFDMYKETFPAFFQDIEYVDGKQYKITGFSDKSKPAGQLAMTNILGVQPSVGGQDSITRLITQRNELQKAINATTDENEKAGLTKQLNEIQGAIDLQSTRKAPLSYVFSNGQMVAAGEGVAGAYQQADAISKATELNKMGNALASAYGLADGLSASLASTPTPADATGVFALFGKFSGGVSGQINTVINAFGDKASDNEGSYLSGTITDAMKNSTDRASVKGLGSGKYSVGQVFKAFEKATEANTQLRSQLMSFAYALAGSRETGKLTDKDVAAALVTFGGGDIAEGKWFGNPDVLVTGINQALTTATNDFAIRYNKLHKSPQNVKYLKEVEKLDDDAIEGRTSFDVNTFLKDNEGIRQGLSDRVVYDGTGIRMQGLDKYRGDGGGAVEPSSGITELERNYIGVMNEAARRASLDPSDSNYLDAAGLKRVLDTIPQSVKDKILEMQGGVK